MRADTNGISDVGSNTYCDDVQCAAGEGDCDGDSQCASGLVCANDVGANYGFRSIVDVCENPTTTKVAGDRDKGGNSFCVGTQCAAGEGDCDGDSQCATGLVCANDVGANYGFRSIVDVCENPAL